MKKFMKRTIAFVLVCSMVFVGGPKEMDTVEATETEMHFYEDFSDSTMSQERWSGIDTTRIGSDDTGWYWRTNKKACEKVTPTVWTEGDKPLRAKFQYAGAAKGSNVKGQDYGLGLYFLASEEADAVVTVATWSNVDYPNSSLTFATDISLSGTNAQDLKDTAGFKITTVTGDKGKQAADGSWPWLANLFYFIDNMVTIVADYDWTKWESDDQVTITYQLSASSGHTYNTVVTYKYDGDNKPETFTIGFGHNTDIDAKLYYAGANTEMQAAIEAENSASEKFEAFESNPSYQTAQDYLDAYQYLSEESKAEHNENYTKVTEWMNTNWNGYDDFSDSAKSKWIWNAFDTTRIGSDDAGWYWRTNKKTCEKVTPTVWMEGDKPLRTKFQYAGAAKGSNVKGQDYGLGLYFLASEEADAVVTVATWSNVDYPNSGLTFATDISLSGTNAEDLKDTAGFKITTVTGDKGEQAADGSWPWIVSGFSFIDNMVTIVADYDWTKWESDDQVTITYQLSASSGHTYNTVVTYKYDGDNKPETFTIGFGHNADIDAKLYYAEVKTEMQAAIEAENSASEKFEAFESNPSYQTAQDYLDVYQYLIEESKAEHNENYTKVTEWMNTNWNGYDDFSDSAKTQFLWTNNLNNKIVDYGASMTGSNTVHSISPHLWPDGARPTRLQFSMKQSYLVKGGALTVNLLDSDTTDIQLGVGNWGSGDESALTSGVGYQHYYYTDADWDDLGGYYSTSTNATTGLVDASMTRGGLKSGNKVMQYAVTYDWSQWDEPAEGEDPKVTLHFTATKTNGEVLTFKQTFTYVGTEEKPDTFSIGFIDVNNSAVLDDVMLDYEVVNADGEITAYISEPDFALETLDTTLATYDIESAGERAALTIFGFDFSHKQASIAYCNSSDAINTTETIVGYGAVVMPGIPEGGYDELLADAKILVGETAGTVANAACERTYLVVGEGEVVPDTYTVRILNSEENMGINMTAIGYIKTEITDATGTVTATKYYYTVDYAQDSVTGLLKDKVAGYLKNTSYVSGGAIVSDSALDKALDAYNANNDYSATYDLAAIQTAATTTEVTTDEQKALLKAIHFGITLGVDTKVTE